jgi:hypothetical protein
MAHLAMLVSADDSQLRGAISEGAKPSLVVARADIRFIVEDEPTNTNNKPPAAASGDGGVGPGNYLTRSGRPPMVDLEIYSSGAGVRHLLLWHGDAHAHGARRVATLPDTAGIGRCKLRFTETRFYHGDSESVGAGRCRAIASSASRASTARSWASSVSMRRCVRLARASAS